MMIVRLIGGLGNQLFQYALGRKLSLLLNTNLKLDVTGFEQYCLRNYKLNHFNIIQEFASSEEINKFRGITPFNKVKHKILDFYKPYYKRTYVKEQSLQFDPNIFKVPKDVYLDGYWGSELYFKDIEKTIRKDLSIKTISDKHNEELSNVIRGTKNSVSMHVRRGDFAVNKITREFHGLIPIDYYLTAISVISKKIEDPQFYIFSDDPQWCIDNIKLDYPCTIIRHNNSEKDYEDLRLMTQCQHHIIANSTFSWWGAWLCSNSHKIVIAPQKWLNKPEIRTNIHPDSWILL